MDGSARARFHPLLKRQEGDEYLVGRPETGSFIYLPAEGVRLIELLESGMTLHEAAEAHQARYGEVPDVADFVTGLMEAGLVAEVGGEELGERSELSTGAVSGDGTASSPAAAAPTAVPGGLRPHFASIPQAVAARFFSWPLLWAYGLYIAGAVLLMLLAPRYIPRGADWLFPSRYLVVAVVTMALFGWAHLFLHEFAHLLAARARGIPARLGLGRRLLTPVAECDLSGIYAAPPQQRYLPYLAGILCDALIVSTALYVLALSDWGTLALPVVGYGFLKAVVAQTTYTIAWQLRFPLRTDLYYVITNWLKARNLQQDSLRYIAAWKDRLLRRATPDSLSDVPPRELRLARLYAPVLLFGLSAYWFAFAYFTVPYLMRNVPLAMGKMLAGWHAGALSFVDGLIFLLMLALEWSWIGYAYLLDRRAARQQPEGGATHG